MLSDLCLESRINEFFLESGIDSYDQCMDREHFRSFPHQVDYRHNSHGFRDDEWPDDQELSKCIWCFGDSYTVGLGSPLNHSWVNILQQKTNKRCINISMDGASNDWIADKVKMVAKAINPRHIIIHWSYGHRGQNTDVSLSDETRRIEYAHIEIKEQVLNFIDNLKQVSEYPVVHSLIPYAFPDSKVDIWNRVKDGSWPTLPRIEDYSKQIQKEIKTIHNCYDEIKYYLSNKQYYDKLDNAMQSYNIITVDQLDYARDGMHYGIDTSSNLVQQLIKEI